jgi:S-DNA-T family DNA segregation ATPase FtsK/SpoIIIE
MPSRGTGSKTSRQSRKGTSTRSSGRKTTRKTSRKQQPSALEFSLRPEHQRELLALALITTALVTLIFFLTDKTGGVGKVYVLGITQAFGSGALAIPLVLGALGFAILVMGRLRHSPFVGASVIGVFLVAGTLLTMLEFPVHHIPYAERFDQGGGLVGYTLVDVLDITIGRPAALVVVTVLMLAGILLTFNITLQELVGGMAAGLHRLRMAAAYSIEQESTAERRASPARLPAGQEALVFESPPQPSEELIPTPIAARPTKAGLFRRQQEAEESESAPPNGTRSKKAAENAAPAKSPEPTRQPTHEKATPAALPARTDKQPDKGKESAGKAKGDTEKPGDAHDENVQEPLDGFDVPTVHLAWPLPSLDILEEAAESSMTDEELKSQARLARLIEDTLFSFKVEAQVVGVNPGPAVTQFELQPAVGVKISKITSLEKDLALSLAAPSIRIEAPIPGKAVIGIEIPNSAIAIVKLREVIDSEEFEVHKGKLKLPLGKDISGMPMIADMTRMPHLLVAGSTGSGKSVAINAFLCGLLLRHTPEELKLILIDPKMVELIVYNRVPHLLSPVVTELERVVPTLKWATREMERRYKVFARHGCRNLESYRQLAQRRADLEPMPYILIVIDELADLMMMAPDEIETYICRLAQMARATGIHLIIATQRPSVDVITGLIKANFPSRIAFAVTSQIDSRVILDTPGAEHLLGRGDMLYMAADAAKLVRVQGTFVADSEVEELVSFWRRAKPPTEEPPDDETRTKQQPKKNEQQPRDEPAKADRNGQQDAHTNAQPEEADTASATDSQSASTDQAARETTTAPETLSYTPPAGFLSNDEQEELLPQALALVKQHRRASASLLQRRLRIGYSKAAQLIELLEEQGIVGPADGGRSREVINQDDTDGAA